MIDNKTQKKIIGLLLFFIGVVILLTPFTPGSFLLLVGLQMIYGKELRWWLDIKNRLINFFK